jgi:2-methylaconitate cis-trans-isomerase PrpF
MAFTKKKKVCLSTICALSIIILGLMHEIHSQREEINALKSGQTNVTAIQKDTDIPIFQILLTASGFGITGYQLYVSYLCDKQIKGELKSKRQEAARLQAIGANFESDQLSPTPESREIKAAIHIAASDLTVATLSIHCPEALNLTLTRLRQVNQLVKA